MRLSLLTLAALLCVGPPAHAVPGAAQLKRDYLQRVDEYVHHYDKQLFSKWLSLGDAGKVRARLNQPGITIAVDSDLVPCAQYDPDKGLITVRSPPSAFSFSVLTSGASSLLLWHEAVHALSHGHQSGAITPSRPFAGIPLKTATTASGALPKESGMRVGDMGWWESMTTSGHQEYTAWVGESVDHLYLNWAESCVSALPGLVKLEDKLRLHGKAKPPADVQGYTRRRWDAFVEATRSSIFGQVPTQEERDELEAMTGFRCDPTEVLAGYLGLGYPMEYFGDFITDAQVWKLFPTAAELGTVGMEVERRVTSLENLSRGYILTYRQGPPGRILSLQLSLYGSPRIAKPVWISVTKISGHPVPDVGDGAFLSQPGPQSSDRLIAWYRNAHLMITDLEVEGTLETGLKIRRRAIRPQIAQKLFANMDALPFPAIPPGVMTAPP